VRDTGKGIPLHLREILCTPFLTTKYSRIGLGLAVCSSIAPRHNATLSYITGSQGTTFNLRFNVIGT
ncbi:MAG: sensor histidine kinase, partial [Syntrophomonadaceae bacterium]|nr:sensor histidine kinase [Syntrophomonadaceae bacterium]